MNPSTPPGAGYERLKTLFQGALDQPAASRAAWLRDAAGGDTALLREVESLLHAHDTAGDFLEQPPQIDLDDLAAGLAVGTQVGPYRILEELGRGGMGIVYLAEDVRLGRRLALKSLPQTVAGDPALRERLRREARAAATILHPGVAVVYALEELPAPFGGEDQLLLATEYVPGRTLRQEIAVGRLSADRAVEIAIDIVRALAAAHDAGVVHRDLKPENIIVTAGGSIKVVDFGIAYTEEFGQARQTLEGSLLGTPKYMAPEQLAGARGDARADLYAVGVVLREMLGVMPPELLPVVERCLAHDPGARYGSARELLRALERASRGETARTPTRWWWEFHLAATALVYWLMMIPAWNARGLIGGATGRAFFIAMLAAVIVAANLRFHLVFTSRFYPRELGWLRTRVAPWLQAGDWVFAASLVIGSLLLDERSALAVLLLSFGIGAAVAFLVIEPATTRAAFRHHDPA
jgi:hypothetical protein